MGKKYLFFDAKGQEISLTTASLSQDSLAVMHDGWSITIDQKEFNKFKAADTTASFLSPWSYLYIQYKRVAKERALFIAVLEDHIFAITFADSQPKFWRIYKRDGSGEIESIIEDFLKAFYEKPQSYFIEEIYIYDCEGDLRIEPQEIEGKLFIKSVYIQCDKSKSLQKELAPYVIEEHEESFWRKHKGFLGVIAAIFLVLMGYEAYLRYEIDSYQSRIEELIKQQVKIANGNNDAKSQLMRLRKLQPFINRLKQKNPLIIERIRNIFDLIPPDAYLTKAEFSEKELLLQGVCKNKEALLQSLHEKLSKVYQKGKILFEEAPQGYEGYNFKAIYDEIREGNG